MAATLGQWPGNAGVRQTLGIMARLANQSLTDPNIRAQAAEIVHPLRGNRTAQIQALLAWTRAKIHYVPDPNGTEMLHSPAMMAKAIAEKRLVYGDCDELSMYLATCLKSVGFAPRFKAAGYSGMPYSHVYVICDGLRLDPTRREWLENRLAPYQETSSMEVIV